ncbi:MAG TPA: hydroxymethylglutaryl-CoA lyase [Ktedonobacteraceae bacterium]
MNTGTTTMQLPKNVQVTDVVTRDGFQNEDCIVSTQDKLRVIDGLVRAGVTSIEVTSFVHPAVVPQLADASELVACLPHHQGVTYSALVPNIKGARRALDAGVSELHLVVSASESHNRANLNRSVRESLAGLAEVCSYVCRANPQAVLIASISTAFHCPFEGRTPLERVRWIVEELVAMGMCQVNLADTDGAANPFQVAQTIALLKERFPQVTWSLHLHNTRDMGLANALAGLQAGVTRFDASLGGIGGCPFVPGATGNISTEDLVHMLHEMGIETGIDLDVLLEEGRKLSGIVGHELASQVARAGTSASLHAYVGVRIADSRGARRIEHDA